MLAGGNVVDRKEGVLVKGCAFDEWTKGVGAVCEEGFGGSGWNGRWGGERLGGQGGKRKKGDDSFDAGHFMCARWDY